MYLQTSEADQKRRYLEIYAKGLDIDVKDQDWKYLK
jgi:hypothetical protein